MNSIRELFDQIQRSIATMPMSSRVSSIALIAVTIFAATYASIGKDQTSSDYVLFGGRALSEHELDSVEMSFSRAGLNDWQRNERQIVIPIESRDQYLAALQQASNLPVSVRSSVQEALDKTTIFESSGQRLAREMHAKELDLGKKLSAFPDIRWASVEYDVGQRGSLGKQPEQSASVVVCPEGTKCLPTGRVQTIKDFIRGSYAGMSAEDVVVIDTNSDAQSISANTPIARRQAELKSRLEENIRQTLVGYGALRIQAIVRIDDQPSRAIPITANALYSSRVDSDTDRVSLLRPAQTLGSRDRMIPISQRLASEVRVSIGYPDVFSKDAGQRDRIEKSIRSAAASVALEFMENSRHAAVIDLWEYPSATAKPVPQATKLSPLHRLSGYWKPIAGVLIVLLVVGMTWGLSTIRNVRKESSIQPTASDQGANGVSAPSSSPANEAAESDIQPPSDNDLVAMIENDPDAAVAVIRDWVQQAA